MAAADPKRRSDNARIAAHRMHALHDARDTTAAARTAFLTKFEVEVDPDRTLPDDERFKRARSARRAYFSQLARKSAEVRRAG